MDLVKLLKRIQDSYLLQEEEYLFYWIKENEKYIVYCCIPFVDGISNVPYGGDNSITVYDKETDRLCEIDKSLIDFKTLKDIPIPKGFEIKKGYIF